MMASSKKMVGGIYKSMFLQLSEIRASKKVRGSVRGDSIEGSRRCKHIKSMDFSKVLQREFEDFEQNSGCEHYLQVPTLIGYLPRLTFFVPRKG
jgi:hypothetical protein